MHWMGRHSNRSIQLFGNITSGWYSLCRLFLAAIFAVGLLTGWISPVHAEDPGPRHAPKQLMALAQHWQLAKWKGGKGVCDLYVRHDGLPTYDEIIEACGADVYLQWIATPTCSSMLNSGGSDASSCSGLFARLVGSEQHLFTEYIEIPSMTVAVKATNCLPAKWCTNPPELAFIGNEPLKGFEITKIHVLMGGFDNPCKGDLCRIGMPLTTDKGIEIEYWAESSYGDQSEHKVFTYRNIFQQKGKISYRFDLLGDDWADQAASGSLVWNIFPPINYPLQDVLEQPISYHEISTHNTYLFLAGNLIRSGMVDASNCPGNGLLFNGFANSCGAQIGTEEMISWQNRYDSLIYRAGIKYNVPSKVLKAIIAQESQFWPRSDTPYELGLGMMTENGLDMLLRWNQDYYNSVCKQLLDDETCRKGYPKLSLDEQYLLKSVLLKQIGTDDEIDILAGTIIASEIQTNQLVKNATASSPSMVTTYEDMWKMTIANYYSGSGCLGSTMTVAAAEKKQLLWKDIAEKLPAACSRAKEYVEKVLGPDPAPKEQSVEGGA
jgi:hypothetical protein